MSNSWNDESVGDAEGPEILALAIGQPEVVVLASQPFRLCHLKGSSIGVYVLVCDALGTGAEIYVGSAGDLKKRLHGHPRLNEFASNVRAYAVTAEGTDVGRDEALLVERLILWTFSRPGCLAKLNVELPVGRTSSYERYVGWRNFAAVAAMLIAGREPALRLLSLQALLSGPVLPIEHQTFVEALPASGGIEKRLDRPVSATSLQFPSVERVDRSLQHQPAMLKSGSEIVLYATKSMPGGALMARHEARFAGLIEQIGPDRGILKRDLVFRSISMMTAFVLGSSRGQTHLWSRAPLKRHRRIDPLPLDFWRSHEVHILRRAKPEKIRPAFVGLSIMTEPSWPFAARGHAPTAIELAYSIVQDARQLSREVDLVMSALLACALTNAAAREVFDHVCRKLRRRGLLPIIPADTQPLASDPPLRCRPWNAS
jgi:hypothetical protein